MSIRNIVIAYWGLSRTDQDFLGEAQKTNSILSYLKKYPLRVKALYIKNASDKDLSKAAYKFTKVLDLVVHEYNKNRIPVSFLEQTLQKSIQELQHRNNCDGLFLPHIHQNAPTSYNQLRTLISKKCH